MADKLIRIAIVNEDKCKPKQCRQECKRNCPVVRMGKLCIEVTKDDKVAFISEELCIGCGICVKKCPMQAIEIINLPKDLDKETTHRYGPNSFKLHRLPMPRPGAVLGLVGTNGIGKTTALKVLSGKLKPNLGKFLSPPDWQEILLNFRGSELQNFFTKLLEDDIKAVMKPQYVDQIPKAIKGEVDAMMKKKDERGAREQLIKELDLENILTRQVDQLSGGELQRFAIAMACLQDADIYMFDEPSSYLDVSQRIKAAQTIRSLCSSEKYIIAVEHDLSVLDYLSDFVCCLYGKPGAYGVVTMPFSVREGINIFLAGFIPTENLRFRPIELTFKVAENVQDLAVDDDKHMNYTYESMTKQLGNFHLTVEKGGFATSQIVVMLGQNGTGKTTFIRMMAGLEKADDGKEVPKLGVSYKPQKISPKFPGTVRQLFHKKIRAVYVAPQFVTDVMKPLNMDDLLDQEVMNLSGGELQRVAIVLSLGMPADIYLLDEPSAYLDSEQRIIAAKVIKRFILHSQKTAFIVEHDFIMATYLADRVIVYSGVPAKKATAHTPQDLLSGMNRFLADLQITFRRDPTNHRPRINKMYSVKDKEQKAAGTYFYLDDGDDEDSLIGADGKKLSKAEIRAKDKDKKDAAKEDAKAAPAAGAAAAAPAAKAKTKAGKKGAVKDKKKKEEDEDLEDMLDKAIKTKGGSVSKGMIDEDAPVGKQIADAKAADAKAAADKKGDKSDKKAAAAKPAAAAGAGAAKKPAAKPADDDDDDDEDEPAQDSAPAKKKKPAKRL